MLIAVGCGYPPLASSVPQDSSDVDGDAGIPCDPLGRFSTPEPLGGLSSSEFRQMSGSLSPDERTIYLWREIDDINNDIYIATRARVTDDFSPPEPLMGGVRTEQSETEPWVSPTGYTLLFSSHPKGPIHIQRVTRPTLEDPFYPPLEDLSGEDTSAAAYRTPYVTSDGEELWFVSDRGGEAGMLDVWRRAKSGDGFSSPVLVTELSSPSPEMYPVLTADKLTIYISSTRPHGMGRYDIWRAHRSMSSEAFSEPEPVPELNTTSDDRATWLSPDGCRLYLSSDHDRAMGFNDVFVARARR